MSNTKTKPRKGTVTATMLDKGIDARNRYKVPQKQWRKWSRIARTVFSRVYMFMLHNERITVHPRSPKQTPAQWKTTAWNTAWISADAVDDALPDYIETI